MSLDRTVSLVEAKPKEITGNHWSAEAPPLGPESLPTVLDAPVLARVSFSGALNQAAKDSGLEDQMIAEKIHISAGYMSRAMRGVWQTWAKRLIAFMRVTNSRAPLQWLAHQVGCDLVIRSSREARIRELEAQLAQERSLV